MRVFLVGIWCSFTVAYVTNLHSRILRTSLRQNMASQNETSSDVEMHKPRVSTWGVFERPKDISKTYGGGRTIGVGGVKLDPVEEARKKERAKELLDKYFSKNSPEVQKEQDHAEEIERARDNGRKLMSFGDRYGALEELESVKEYLAWKGKLSAEVYIDLALAYESIGRQEEADKIYKNLKVLSPYQEVRSQAKGLAFGIEAMEKLKINTSTKPLPDWNIELPEIEVDKKYDMLYYQKDADGLSVRFL